MKNMSIVLVFVQSDFSPAKAFMKPLVRVSVADAKRNWVRNCALAVTEVLYLH
jgi:hypothetical protein